MPSSSAQGALADGERVIVGMGQGQDGLDLVVAGDPPHRPVFLPASPVELAVLHDREFAGQDVVVAVPPELLGREDHQADRQGPCATSFRRSHPADLPNDSRPGPSASLPVAKQASSPAPGEGGGS